ncbi:ataxin-2 homolog [Lucilia cuprina]|uniref:ataxin-2 homolog n=1 Tax=Lucilia cuprina TaxID=7375 RepID=UPI001F052A4D|nr:ataxin-2 homolog [Lucilia cuprina]
MNVQTKLLKIMLRLWTLTLAVSLISLQLTTASTLETTATPASESTNIATQTTKVLRLTTTASTIQLRLHDSDSDDDAKDKTKVLTTSKELTSREQESAASTTSFTTITSSISTLASSNAPATITNEAKEALTRKQTAATATLVDDNEERQEESQEYKITDTTTWQYKNHDKLEGEIKETDLKQVTESVEEQEEEQQQQQQHQQQEQEQITTEVNWRKETDMHKQSTGNTRNAENDIKITATIATRIPTHTTHPTTASSNIPTTKPVVTTTTTTLTGINSNTKESAYTDVAATFPSEHQIPDHVKQKEIAGDNIKFTTSLPLNGEMEAITLNLSPDIQAMEDFKPLIKDANEKLIKERTIFSNNDDWKQNLMPNELEYESNKPLISKTYEHNINWSPYLHPATPVTDFTGKLLQEQDGVITEIEQKFRLNEFVNTESKPTKDPSSTTAKSTVDRTQTTTFSKDPHLASSYSVNHEILDINKNPLLNRTPVQFIERRVKKSFDFPMHRVASDALHMQQHFDFANTKFNSNNNEQQNALDTNNEDGQQKEADAPPRPQPEFSTTKFYNSKELYNEMLQHKTKLQQLSQTPLPQHTNPYEKDIQDLNNRTPSLALNSFAVLHSPKIAKLEEIHDLKEPQQQKSLAIKNVTVKATKHKELNVAATTVNTTSTSITNTPVTPTKPAATKYASMASATEMPLAALVKTKKFQKELKRAKLLIKSMMPLQNATTEVITNTANNNSINEDKSTSTLLPPQAQTLLETKQTSHTPSSILSLPYTAAATTTSSTSTTTRPLPSLSVTSTNPPKTSLRPIVRPRILSRLQEKINSLECELQNLPQDSHLWRGNETHELLLPIMVADVNVFYGCFVFVLFIYMYMCSAHNTQVYQVTRSGHEHCDVTEGILLDITPLIVDGRKLVTLYDKDLTEGVNLLIGEWKK